MSFVKRINELAGRFERKISLAQAAAPKTNEEAGGVEDALEAAGLKPTAAQFSPFLNKAAVPEDVSLDIKIIFDNKLSGKFTVYPKLLEVPVIDPSLTGKDKVEAEQNKKQIIAKNATAVQSSARLAALLTNTFAPAMSAALKKAGKKVTDSVEINMATF